MAELLDALQLEDVVPVGNDTGGAITHIFATARPRDSGARADHLRRLRALPVADPQALSPPRSSGRHATAARQPLRTRIGRKRGSGALAHADIDARAEQPDDPRGSSPPPHRARDDQRLPPDYFGVASALCSATRKCPNPRSALASTNSPKRYTPQEPASRVREHGRVTP